MCIFQAAAYFRPSDLQVDSLFTSSISFLFVRHPFERIVSAFRSAPAPPPSKVFCILRLLLLLLNLPLMPPFQTCQPYLFWSWSPTQITQGQIWDWYQEQLHVQNLRPLHPQEESTAWRKQDSVLQKTHYLSPTDLPTVCRLHHPI